MVFYLKFSMTKWDCGEKVLKSFFPLTYDPGDKSTWQPKQNKF